MTNLSSPTLMRNDKITDNYVILLPIKSARNATTYRVRGADSRIYFLKLFDLRVQLPSDLDTHGNVLEIQLLKNLNHPNINVYRDSGSLNIEGRYYQYLVSDFIPGETLLEHTDREPFSRLENFVDIFRGVLNGLDYLHRQSTPIMHNQVIPSNVMIDLSSGSNEAKIIDFGYARHQKSSMFNMEKNSTSKYYIAPEALSGQYSPQSDIFSVGATMYQSLFGSPPWSQAFETSGASEVDFAESKHEMLSFEELFLGSHRSFDGSELLIPLLAKAMTFDPAKRYASAQDMLQHLDNLEHLDHILVGGEDVQSSSAIEPDIDTSKKKGFAAIAGMHELKLRLQKDIIEPIANPELYKEYGVTMPNGMLLYGPPGCGKTYFAKKLAEEVGANFMIMMPSDIKSKYVNATQENIARMFKDAEKRAPSIIFIDEINELVPDRDSDVHEMYRSAVNEMLAQMDRTGEKRIFVIGATNKPEQIDPAILRTGRIDYKVYVPPPDFEARVALFQLHLDGRPIGDDISFEQLAEQTDRYVSSDIEYIVNEAARNALRSRIKIDMVILLETINQIQPSIDATLLEKYEEMRIKFESNDRTGNRKIGF